MWAIARKTESGLQYLCYDDKMIVGTKQEMENLLEDNLIVNEFDNTEIVEVDDE